MLAKELERAVARHLAAVARSGTNCKPILERVGRPSDKFVLAAAAVIKSRRPFLYPLSKDVLVTEHANPAMGHAARLENHPDGLATSR